MNKIETIGIIGDGQLAMMLSEAAKRLNLSTICYGQNQNSPASYTSKVMLGSLDDTAVFNEFINNVDVVTYETENIDITHYKKTFSLLENHKLYPSLDTLKITQNRVLEKNWLNDIGIETANYYKICSYEDLIKYVKLFNYKCVLKTASFGYDGKGQYIINNGNAAKLAWEQIGKQELILEQLVNFDCELSIIAARDLYNNIKFYPLTKNTHKNGMLRLSEAPYNNAELQTKAEIIAEKIINSFDYIGVIAIELFKVNDKLIVNEIAPRVHNSGHWTIEGAKTCQFTNHMLAVSGQEIKDTSAINHSAMLNCIGRIPNLERSLINSKIEKVYFHDYHKQARPNRKLGHITLNNPNKDILKEQADKLSETL